MGRKNKYTAEAKIKAVEQYLNGNASLSILANELDVDESSIRAWKRQYQKCGAVTFIDKPRNKSYSKELKNQAIQDYLDGHESYEDITLKYDITSSSILKNWVIKYNELKPIKDYDPKGEVYMKPARKTTLEERIKIVNYCIEHDLNYAATAEFFDASYAQVYQWVKKYNEQGNIALEDKRGRKKTEEELTPIEVLERKIKILENQLELKERETILLKKVKEIEGRRYSPKPSKNRNTK